jgi:beta-N-acetylhexosaminidase
MITTDTQAFGSVMLDLTGYEITAEEKELLQHPAVGGVIYFSRNYHDQAQLQALVKSTRAASRQPLLLAVDHEGGRVQRFRHQFTHVPAMGQLWPAAADARIQQRVVASEAHDQLSVAQAIATEMAWLMASEVLAHDIDFSFAPVADVWGCCDVIQNRAFHADAEPVIAMVSAFAKGMHQAGMKTTGKHFPGHGSVKEDSHLELPIDRRSQAAIEALDLKVFRQLAAQGALDAVMPAHVVYPAFCDKAAGFSRFWLQQVLRQQMQFDGVIFSDDLGMAGAHQAGNYQQRAAQAFAAGCDMVLVCNDRAGAVEVIDTLAPAYYQHSSARLARLKHHTSLSWSELCHQPRHQAAVALAADIWQTQQR